jgi:hypothetical protein
MTDTPAPRRKSSQKRQRNKQISTPCTAEEFNAVSEKARAAGMSNGAYSRAVLLGSPGPRAQRALPVDADLLHQFLAACGRHGNNWNQIAYKLNINEGPRKLQHDIEAELANLRRVVALGLAALGKNPRPV